MAVGALLADRCNGAFYNGYTRAASGREGTSPYQYFSNGTPGDVDAQAGAQTGEQNTLKPRAPLSYTRRITADIQMEEMTAGKTENGERIYSYQASRQQFEIYIHVNGDERNYVITGTDAEGNAFEKSFDPYSVDPENADFTEFTALCLYIQQTEQQADEIAGSWMEPDDILQKQNYMTLLGEWSYSQAQIGNTQVYERAMGLLDAIHEFLSQRADLQGNSYVSFSFLETVEEVSEEAVARLLEDRESNPEKVTEYTKSTFTNNDPQKLDTVFYTYYSPDGIKCIREGERDPENPSQKLGADELCWEIKLDSKEQYEQVMRFLASFPEEDNLRFASKETFWNDFLQDAVDMESFRDFYAWTDHGEMNLGIGENGEQVGFNKARLTDPNAKYFNDQTWIGRVWTEEELQAMLLGNTQPGSSAESVAGAESAAVSTGKKTAREYREQAFDQIGIYAPESVKQAWLDAADVAGMDGMGISDSGMLDHIPQFLIQRWLKGSRGGNANDMLGNSVETAMEAANNALYALEHPLEPNRVLTAEQRKNLEKEKMFYEEFLKRLSGL